MQVFLAVGLLGLVVGTAACACTRDSIDDAHMSTNGYMKLDLYGKQTQQPILNRQNNIPIYTDVSSMSYFVNVSIGSDDQNIPLQLDTGSPITWVNPDCSNVLDDLTIVKATYFAQPRYDSSTSSTSKTQGRSLNISCDTGSVLGSYFTDNIRIGSLVARNALFGVADATYERGSGILGVGARSAGYPPTIVDTLAAQGQIASRTFSIGLGANGETGTLILGGIDTKKYRTLTKVPTRHLLANLTNISMSLPNTTTITFPPSLWRSNTSSIPILFDSGTPTNLLPNALYFAIGALYPDATPYTHPLGYPAFKVPCAAPAGTFDYTFGTYTINIPFADSLHKDEKGICSFGFSLGPKDEWEVPYVLGAAFMRGAYMVFDLKRDEVWMGEKKDG